MTISIDKHQQHPFPSLFLHSLSLKKDFLLICNIRIIKKSIVSFFFFFFPFFFVALVLFSFSYLVLFRSFFNAIVSKKHKIVVAQ